MTNHERWRIYTKRLPSPDSYVDIGFYWLIAACLQRRVWYYSGDLALYPNAYVVLVGPPSVGKGICLGLVNELMRFHKWEKGMPIQTNAGPELPMLYPVGADSTTFEELMDDMAKSIRRMTTPENTSYSHTSFAFILEELDSLFKRKTEDVARFLKNAYDCKNFEYKTKHQGQFLIRRPCLSFFAATQESFLRDAYKNKLFGEGFMSRTLFVFEKKPRSFAFHFSEFDDEQKQAKLDLLLWLKDLATLYGEIKYSDEIRTWLNEWYVSEIKPRLLKIQNERMLEYYGRKKVTMLKLAAGIHFAESTSMEMPREPFERAMRVLNSLEPEMAKAINFAGRNETHFYLLSMLEYITQQGVASLGHIIKRFGADVEIMEIQSILLELELGYGVKKRINGKETVYELPRAT